MLNVMFIAFNAKTYTDILVFESLCSQEAIIS